MNQPYVCRRRRKTVGTSRRNLFGNRKREISMVKCRLKESWFLNFPRKRLNRRRVDHGGRKGGWGISRYSTNRIRKIYGRGRARQKNNRKRQKGQTRLSGEKGGGILIGLIKSGSPEKVTVVRGRENGRRVKMKKTYGHRSVKYEGPITPPTPTFHGEIT